MGGAGNGASPPEMGDNYNWCGQGDEIIRVLAIIILLGFHLKKY